jgi:hypothetical protein
MAKIYKGQVSIFANTKGEAVVKADPNGQFTFETASELYTALVKAAKEHKLKPRVFKPEAAGDTPVLMADRWGNPYLALLPQQKVAGPVVKVTKLA